MECSDLDSLELFGSLLRAASRRTAANHDLPVVHSDILAYLARCNAWSDTVLTVADYLGLTKGTVSQSIKLLGDRGYLEKIPDENDRRVQHLHLTLKGRDYIAALNESLQTRLAGVEAGGAYNRLLKTIVGDLTRQVQRRQSEGPTFGSCGTCRFYKRADEGGSCGKMGHKLAEIDRDKLCRLYSATD